MIKSDKIKSLIACLVVISLVFLTSIPFFSHINKKLSTEVPLGKLENSAGEITIITPENKTYTEPMSGYYPATYGFENEADGDIPEGLIFIPGGVAGSTEVIAEVDGHKKVAELVDSSTVEWPSLREFTNQSEGSFDFWIYKESGNTACTINLRGDINDEFFFTVWLDNQNDGKFYYRHSGGDTEFGVGQYQDQTWFHIRIDFNTSSSTSSVYLNGQLVGSNLGFYNPANYLTQILFRTIYALTGTFYLDAVGFSWDLNYNIGDNLDDGLLLSYENSTLLDWKAYSLDGASNRPILGNKTIPMPSDGLHSIQVFGNDSMGTIYESDVRYFTVATGAPDITINSPSDSQFFGVNAPDFDLTIIGPYEAIWYTLDDGVTNVTADGLTGTIDQTQWDKKVDEVVFITFYANNSIGQIGTAEVVVVKHATGGNGGPQIPGYNVIALIGVSCIVTLLILKKQK